MKKIVLTGLLAASSCLMAQEYKPFVGVEVSSSAVEWETSGRTSGHETGYGLRAGLNGEDHRMYIGIGQADTEGDNVTAAALNLEGMTSPYRLTNWLDTRFFVGAHIGTTEYDDDYDFVYGGQGGIMFGFPSDMALEIGYRYSWSDAENVDHGESVYGALNFQF